MRTKRLKILILIKPFWKDLAKHKSKFDFIKSLEQFADIYYWYENGSILNIIKKLNINPDFIFHYEVANYYKLSPKITDLDKIDIPKGCFIIDSHYNPDFRRDYIIKNKIDLVFSVTKENFLKVYPDLRNKFVWLPWSINTRVFRDWSQNKEYDFLLMGLINPPQEGKYPFREKVLEVMSKYKNFKHHKHPGHLVSWKGNPMVDINYAKEINKAKIFFTCGSTLKYPVLKFIEVPACNTLLLAEPNSDIIDMGFRDGVNFVACSKENFEEKAEYYLKNSHIRNRISQNGMDFVHKSHSNEVRAQQFIREVTNLIVEKKISKLK